jgi:hypothetical protein
VGISTRKFPARLIKTSVSGPTKRVGEVRGEGVGFTSIALAGEVVVEVIVVVVAEVPAVMLAR